VQITTRPPGAAEPITFEASADGLTGAPEEGIVSFGFNPELPRDREAHEDQAVDQIQATTHRLGCPAINLFPDREACEAWDADTDAITMPVPVAEALGLAQVTARAWQR